MASDRPLDPSIIDTAPITPDRQNFNEPDSDYFIQLVGKLAAENDELRAEAARLKGKETYDDVRRDLMKPYATRVFRFLICYCLFVGATLVFQGFKIWGFNLSDTVMAVISGSTAASAIGLVGFVVNGLFRAKQD